MHTSFWTLSALALASSALALPVPKPQIGGDAQAAYYILNNLDNGTGYATENAMDNIADLYEGKPTGTSSEGGGAGSGTPGNSGTGGGAAPPPAKGKGGKRQLNKISAGIASLGTATGTSATTDPVVNAMNEIDTVGTDGQGQIGYNIGEIEDPMLPEIANEATNLDPNGSLPPLDPQKGQTGKLVGQA